MKNRHFVVLLTVFLALALILACSGPEEKKMKFFEKGKAFYEQGDFVKARLELKNAVQIDAKFAAGYYYLGLTAQEQRDFKRAFGYFSKAAELDPNLLDAQAAVGKYLLASGKREEALQRAEAALAAQPDHLEALLLKAAVLIADKDPEAAAALLEDLPTRGVKDPQVYRMLAAAYFMEGDKTKAEDIYRNGIAANPDDSGLLLALAQFYQKTDKRRAAAETVLKAIEVEPENVNYKFLLADLYWEENRFDDAIEIIDGVVNSGIEKPDIYRLAAQFYSAKKRPDKVRQILAAAIEKNPQAVAPRIMLGRYYLEQNEPYQAQETLEACLKLHEDDASAEMVAVKNALATVHLVLRNEKEAEDLIEEVLEASPNSVEGHDNKGKLHLLEGDGVNAVSEFRTVVTERPDFIPAYLRLAAAYELDHKRELAIDTLKNAMKIDPDAKDVLQNLARLYVLTEDYFGAEELLRKILTLYPEDERARAELGDFLLAREDVEGANKQYEILKLESPDNPIGYLKLGQLYVRLGKLERALSEVQEGYRRHPRSVLLAPMVQLLVRLQKSDAAVAACQDHIKSDPGDPVPHNLLGWVYINRKEYPQAEAALKEAIRISPEWPAPHTNLAQLYLLQGKEQEAVERLEASMEAHPRNPTAYLSLCKIYEGAGDYRKAIDVYERALEQMPDFWFAANNLAFLLSEQSARPKDLERALAMAEKAHRLKPGHPLVTDTLAWVHYKMDNNVQARVLLEEALDKLPDDPTLNYHLAMALYRDGLLKEARFRLEKALGNQGDFIGRAAAEETLTEIKAKG